MPKERKVHSVDVQLTSVNADKLANGRGIKIHPNDNADGGKYTIVFKSKAVLTRLYKNYNAGKATIIKPEHIKEVLHNGGSFFGSLKSMAKSALPDLAKAVAPKLGQLAGDAIGKLTKNDELGNLAGNTLNKGLQIGANSISQSGSGVRRKVKVGGSFAPLGGAVSDLVSEIQQYQGITGTPSLGVPVVDHKARMAHVRSFRKQ